MTAKSIKTEPSIYQQHLQIQTQDLFVRCHENHTSPTIHSPPSSLRTNFGVTLRNQFAFLVLHLRKSKLTKNILGINIPDICIFSQGIPYELLYSDSGEIRSMKGKEGIRLSEMHSFFKNRAQKKGLPKDQPSLACFQAADLNATTDEEQYLMLSDTDLFICCRKFRNDPFFSRLQYLRNKFGGVGDPVQSVYSAQKDYHLTGFAMQGLMGFDHCSINEMGEDSYLRYLGCKIALYLNFQNNIRLSNASFFFAKTNDNIYYLVNVRHMVFDNLTFAMRDLSHRLKLKQEERNKILILTQEKEKRYKKYLTSPKVKVIEGAMNKQWEEMAARVRIRTNEARKREEQKNEQAFSILFPDVKVSLKDLVTQSNFKESRRKVLKLEDRKPIHLRKRYSINYRMGNKRYTTEPAFETVEGDEKSD